YARALDAGLVKIPSKLDDRRSESPHGGVLICGIAVRDIDRRRNSGPGGRKSRRQPVIPTRRGDDAGDTLTRLSQGIQIDDPAANLECTDWSVILVLHPYFAPGSLGEAWPDILGRRQHCAMHELRCRLEFGVAKERGSRG